MPIRRGDVVTVATSGDYGKPRPAVVVQSDAFPETYLSVIVCQMTSDLIDGHLTRITVEPASENGLRLRSQIMVDKPTTLLRRRVGRTIGRLSAEDVARLDAALAFVLGLARANSPRTAN